MCERIGAKKLNFEIFDFNLINSKGITNFEEFSLVCEEEETALKKVMSPIAFELFNQLISTIFLGSFAGERSEENGSLEEETSHTG